MFLFMPKQHDSMRAILQNHSGSFGPAFFLSEERDGEIAVLYGFYDNHEACEALKNWIAENGFQYRCTKLE